MADSILFDSTELVSATYVVRSAKADSFSRELDTMPRIKDDGETLIDSRIIPKSIIIRGVLVGSSASDLQSKIDTLKKVFAGKQKNLDITPNGGTLRRYIATCVKLDMNERDHYHIDFCPYTAEFLALEGVGKATATTEILNSALSADYSGTKTLTVGSTEQKPIFSFTFNTAGSIGGVKIRNFNTTEDFDESLIITNPFVNSDQLVIDFDAKTVLLNGAAIPYYGKFPKFIIGDNALRINFGQLTAESISVTGSSSNNLVHGNNWVAQSFYLRHTDATYRSIYAMVAKNGSPPNNLTVTIEGDNAGKPDGSALATFTITAASIASTPDFKTVDNASNFTLNANTRYWLVYKTTAGDVSNNYNIYSSTTDTYAKGNKSESTDAGSNWTNDYTEDIKFSLLFGGKPAAFSVATVVNYYPRYL